MAVKGTTIAEQIGGPPGACAGRVWLPSSGPEFLLLPGFCFSLHWDGPPAVALSTLTAGHRGTLRRHYCVLPDRVSAVRTSCYSVSWKHSLGAATLWWSWGHPAPTPWYALKHFAAVQLGFREIYCLSLLVCDNIQHTFFLLLPRQMNLRCKT